MKPTPVVIALALLSLVTACSTTHPGQRAAANTKSSPETVLVTYHVKPGKEDEFEHVLSNVWVFYRKQHLVFAEPHLIVRVGDRLRQNPLRRNLHVGQPLRPRTRPRFRRQILGSNAISLRTARRTSRHRRRRSRPRHPTIALTRPALQRRFQTPVVTLSLLALSGVEGSKGLCHFLPAYSLRSPHVSAQVPTCSFLHCQ